MTNTEDRPWVWPIELPGWRTAWYRIVFLGEETDWEPPSSVRLLGGRTRLIYYKDAVRFMEDHANPVKEIGLRFL
jgi:hypothetical protein